MIGIDFSAFQSFPHQILADLFSYSGKQKDPEHACPEYRGSGDIIIIIVRMKKNAESLSCVMRVVSEASHRIWIESTQSNKNYL